MLGFREQLMSPCSNDKGRLEAGSRLRLLGVSFRTAPVAVRESLSFATEDARSFQEAFSQANPGIELMILSTCNRTEFYLASEDGPYATKLLLESLRLYRPGASIFNSNCRLYERHDVAAARHLFRVASGLDSAILGDGQILGQVKSAMRLAGEAGSMGASLNHVLTRTMRVAKRSCTQTEIGRGNVGLGSAVAALLRERETKFSNVSRSPRTLILGAGEIASEIGRNLSKNSSQELVFMNRNRNRAELLAAHCGGRVEDWESLPQALAEADFVIAATASSIPIVTEALVGTRLNGRTCLYVDAGVPRNIEMLPGREVLNVDSIRSYQKIALETRQSAIPIVERLVELELKAWSLAESQNPVEEMIATLFRKVKELRSDNSSLISDDKNRTDSTLHRSIDELLGKHARELREWSRKTERMER
ncbi:MAG: glutamyl-tRNA reductase [Candidatus Pelagisphaera sp.]|jgi:glutamyl-tRNA reductase